MRSWWMHQLGVSVKMAPAQATEAFEPSIGATLNERYELEACIGVGGMGEVWRAKDKSLRRQVAIKFLSGALAQKEETRDRFLVEAQVTAQLNSRHAVHVYDFGVTVDGHPYFVLELLNGETLAKRLERTGKLDAETTVIILQKAARALSRAHALRIVHRDFKPDNIFLTVSEEGDDHGEEVKVVDFGIAKLIGTLEEARSSVTPEDLAVQAGRTLTRTNGLVGTPQYMSPEQIRQQNMGPSVDIWALGVVAFECLTGSTPFSAPNVLGLFANIQLGKSASAHELHPDVPAAFDAWFKRATALEAADRFADPNRAITELAKAILPAPVIERRRPSRAWAALAAVALVTVGVLGVLRMRRHEEAPPSREPSAMPTMTASTTQPAPVAPVAPGPSASAREAALSASAAASTSPAPKASAGAGKGRGRSPRDVPPAEPSATSKATSSAAPPPRPPSPSSSSPFTLPPLGI
ncbi:serine/threonine protein kinase [Pendulispora rubella]|uniref:Serine/threonine protein kinase n=1 Tax=Pendulispora rubella TaxID=2741070 RepID=A0ABZ2KY30_9BACT